MSFTLSLSLTKIFKLYRYLSSLETLAAVIPNRTSDDASSSSAGISVIPTSSTTLADDALRRQGSVLRIQLRQCALVDTHQVITGLFMRLSS